MDAVLNSIPDGVAMTEADGGLTYTNRPMAVLLGLKDAIGNGSANAREEPLPKMTELLVKRWKLAETDPLLAAENRDRAMVAELTRDSW